MADVMSGPYLAGLQLRYQREAKEEERAKRKRLNDALMSAFKPGRDEALPFETDEEQAFGLPPLQGNVAGFERRPAEFDDDRTLQSLVSGGFAPEAYAIVSGRADEKRKAAAAIQQKMLEKQIDLEAQRAAMQDFMGSVKGGSPSKFGYSQKQGANVEFDPNAAIQREIAVEDYRTKYGRYPPGYAAQEAAPDVAAPPSVRPSAPAPIGATPSRTTAAQPGPPPGLPYGERQKWLAEDAKSERGYTRDIKLREHDQSVREYESGLKLLDQIDEETTAEIQVGDAAERIERLLPESYTGLIGQHYGYFDPNSNEIDKLSAVILRAKIKPGTSGTMNSDKEQELLMKSVPLRGDQKLVTRNFTRAIAGMSKNQSDRQEFMHAYMDKFGNLRNAKVEWKRYISDNPTTITSDEKRADVIFNPNKKSWQSYFPWAQEGQPQAADIPVLIRGASGKLERAR